METIIENNIILKLGDIYSFRYNEAWASKKNDPYHCFDGQLIVRKGNEQLVLVDTYWSHDNTTFTLSEALEKGLLTFKCNLEDVETIREDEIRYYDDEDVVNLSRQHGCYKNYTKYKTATKSPTKIKSVLLEMKEVKEFEIEHAQRSIGSINEKLERLEKGDLDFYI